MSVHRTSGQNLAEINQKDQKESTVDSLLLSRSYSSPMMPRSGLLSKSATHFLMRARTFFLTLSFVVCRHAGSPNSVSGSLARGQEARAYAIRHHALETLAEGFGGDLLVDVGATVLGEGVGELQGLNQAQFVSKGQSGRSAERDGPQAQRAGRWGCGGRVASEERR